MTVSITFTTVAAWLAVCLALVLVRQGLMWFALRRLKPTILHRIGLPEGHRIRAPMRFGIAWTLAKLAGWVGTVFLTSLVLYPIIASFDQGWTAPLGITLMVLTGIVMATLTFDRFLASSVRQAVGLPVDWRTRAL